MTEVWKTYRQPSAAGDWPSAKLSLQTRTDFADFASPVGQAARLASEAKTLAAPTVDITALFFGLVQNELQAKAGCSRQDLRLPNGVGFRKPT